MGMPTRNKRAAFVGLATAALAAFIIQRARSRTAPSPPYVTNPAPLVVVERAGREDEGPPTTVDDSTDHGRRWAYVLAAVTVFVVAAMAAAVAINVSHRGKAAAPLPSPAVAASAAPVVPDTAGPPCPSADPCRIRIKSINVDTTVVAKPTVQEYDPFVGKTVASFGVPDNFTTTSWWSDGPVPGKPGMAVILGHHYDEGYGVFNELSTLRAGDVVEVRAGVHVLDYQVDSIDNYLPKTDASALSDALSAHAKSEDLALVSCTGAVDSASHQIVANVVVFASLVAEAKVSQPGL